jgi:WD40 repeat protein/energy-coupling factor transporter ATP-binding protein EcfA2
MFNESGIVNPFPGLRSFEEDEDVLFFGREKQVDELLTKLRTTRFLAVIGSSGSGKSSLVKSGLIPALYSGFMSGAGSSWRVCTFRPGNDPISNMAEGLSEAGVLYDDDGSYDKAMLTSINESILRRSSTGLVGAYKQSGIDTRHNLLILVDQFEELFRFSKYEKDNKDGKRDSIAFINLLIKATEQREIAIYVVFTMRSDFLSDCTEFRGLPEAINNGDYLVPRMTREERKDAITGPVSVAGATIAPRLLNQLLNDVGDNPDQLPILQHALMRTWDVWKKKNVATALDIEEYEEIGTMKHALSQHAEEAYAELTTDKQKHICEVLFKTLTDRGSDSRGIRRPRRLGEICALAEASQEELIEVINVFRKGGRAFLMPPEKVVLTEASIIDISHESIMRVWNRLIDWVDEENESAQVYFRLCEAALTYEEGKGGLWRDPELQIAWKWKEENKPNEIWASRYNNQFSKAMAFLDYSKQQFDLELKHKEELQKQKLKRAKRVAIIISLVAIGALFLAIYAFDLKNLATKQTKLANKKTIEAEQQKSIAIKQTEIAEQNREQAMQQKSLAEKNEKEALNQRNIADQQRVQAERSKQDALMQKTIAEEQKTFAVRQKDRADSNAQIAKVQQGIAEKQTEKAVTNENIAKEEQRVSTRLKDLASARNLAFQSLLLYNERKYVESKEDAIEAYRLNEKNAGPSQNSDIYNALHYNWINEIGYRNQFIRHVLPVHTITGKPGTNILFSADEAGIIYAIESSNDGLTPIAQINVQQEVRSLSCSPDGTRLVAITAKGTGILFEISTSNTLREINRFHFNGVGKTVLFASNTAFYLVSGATIGRYQIDNQVAREESVKQGNVGSIALGKSGKIYIASSNKIMVYDQWSNVFDKSIDAYTLSSQITSVAIDPDERVIAAGTYNGSVWIRDTKTKQETSQALHLSGVNDLCFAKVDGNRLQLASAGADQVIKMILVDALLQNKNTEDILTLRGHTKWIYGLYYSPDGKYLFSCSEDTKVIGWRSGMGSLYQTLNVKK